MKRFSDYAIYLFEDVPFIAGQNQNFVALNGKDDSVVFLSRETKKQYKENGQKTKGLQGHSLKHMAEFNKTEYMAIAGQIRAAVKDMLDKGQIDFIELAFEGGKTEQNPDKVFKQSRAGSWINAADAIQDMVMQNKSITEPEKVVYGFGKKLAKLYSSEIEQRIRDAVDVDKMTKLDELQKTFSTRKVVRFTVWRRGTPNKIFLDLKDNVIIIMRGEKVATAFEYNVPASNYKGVVKNFVNKFGMFDMDNKNLYMYLKEIGK